VDPASWDKAKNVLFEALERAAEEREAFVRERCADPTTCDEILALLSSARTRDDILARAPVGAFAGVAPAILDDSEALAPGSTVGPYLILDRIGSGGMGRVFLGTDPRLQRRVALKCLLDSRATGADVRSRILHEARAAARIANQHVATVHDVIEHESRAFIVMEYVEGESLSARLKRGRLPSEQVLAFGRQLVSALAAAHATGIVHRDLKPGNIQVTPAGLVKVLDFGIASATRSLVSAASGATTAPPVVPAASIREVHPGTPPYMSPEQLLGRAVDERSDIYSLGVVLFEMCTGRRPYPEKEASRIAQAQARGVPRADGVERAVPRSLANVIARAMAIDVDDRYQTVVELGVALEEVEQALKNRSESLREVLHRWLARLAIVAPASIVGVGVIGFVTSMQFNLVFGRDGELARFGVEPWPSYIVWGLLGVIPVLLIMTVTAAGAMGAKFLLGLLELVGPIGRIAKRIRERRHAAAVAIGLHQPAVLAQALTGLAIATLLALFWYYADLIRAYSSFFNSSPIAQLMPMTDSAPARWRYHIALSLSTLVFAFGFYKVMKLRAREHTQDGRIAVGMLAAVIVVMILMNEAPYRTFHHRDLERVDFAGAHCYVNGESGAELLVLCPGREPPRNRVVSRSDPQVHRLGIKENVFKGVNPVR